MGRYVKCTFEAGTYNNHLIAGNVCNAFALGELGSTDDFFLVGAEPQDESPYPLLTGNFLDSEGNVLFRLVRNVLVVNPGQCSRLLGDLLGYEVHDSAGRLILAVRTAFETLPDAREPCYVTTIKANFYDRKAQLVFAANSGEPNEHIHAQTKHAIGFSGGFGLVSGYTDVELELARHVLRTRGRIHRLLQGIRQEGGEFQVDGNALIDCRLSNTTIQVRSGDFVLLQGNSFERCKFQFQEEAGNVYRLIQLIKESQHG
jgi:hypothetical protein